MQVFLLHVLERIRVGSQYTPLDHGAVQIPRVKQDTGFQCTPLDPSSVQIPIDKQDTGF